MLNSAIVSYRPKIEFTKCEIKQPQMNCNSKIYRIFRVLFYQFVSYKVRESSYR